MKFDRHKLGENFRFALTVVISLQWSCAASPPEATPINRGSGDATMVADSPCSKDGQASLVAAGVAKAAVENLCGYRVSLESSEYVYRGSGNLDILTILVGADGVEPKFKFSGSNEKLENVRLVNYSGLLVPSSDVSAVVDVIRFQAFFPTDFKSQFEVDPLVTYSPAGQAADNFGRTAYNFKKTGTDGLGDVHYDGRMQVLRFSDGSYAVFDKLDRKVSGSLIEYQGLVFYILSGSNTAVIGRSEQTFLGQNQTVSTVASNVTNQMIQTLKMDFKNYSRAQPARQFMDTKRSANAGQ